MFAFVILLHICVWETVAEYPYPDTLHWTDGTDTIYFLNPTLTWIDNNQNTNLPSTVDTDSRDLKKMKSCAFLYSKNFVIVGDIGTQTIYLIEGQANGTLKGAYVHTGTSYGLGQLTVDWLSGNLYWTDGDFGWIGMQRLPDSYKNTINNDKFKVVVGNYLDQPSGVAVHPEKRLLFWSDIGSQPKIERSTLYGGSRELIVFKGLFKPRSIAIDYNNNRLYWVDSARGTVESSDLMGQDRSILMSKTEGLLYDIDFYEGHVLVADTDGKKIYSLSDTTGLATSDPYSVSTSPLSVLMFSERRQPSLEGLCHGIDCDHICVETTGGARCICEEGFHIEPDGETCTAETAIPYRSILYTNGSKICSLEIQILYSHRYVQMDPICFLDIQSDDVIEHFHLDVEGRMVFFAVGPKIFVQHLNEDTHQTVYISSDTITDFIFDWVNEKLIWCEKNSNNIYAKTVGDLETLPLADAEILFSDIISPISLTIDPHSRRIFWISDGDSAEIAMGSLDDNLVNTIVEGSTLFNPRQIVYDGKTDRLYWTATGRINSIRPSGLERKVQMLPSTASYEAITVFRDFVIWTSTSSDTTNLNAQLGDEDDTHISFQLPDTYHVKQIAVFSQQQQPEDPEPCSQNNGGCDHFCIATGSIHICKCDFGYSLQEDGQSCVARPFSTNFFMVTDVLSKTIYQIEQTNGSVRTVYTSEGNVPVRVIFNPVDNNIVFADGSSNLIKNATLSGGEEYILTSTGTTVAKGLAIDTSTGNIYFTTGDSIAVMNGRGKNVKTLMTGQNDVGSIVLFPSKGYMVWYTIGSSPRVNKGSMDGSQALHSIVVDDIESPKDLAIDYEDEALYWCDDALNKIEMVDLRSYLRKTVTSAVEKPVALAVDGNFIYYIDGSHRRILKISKATGSLLDEVFDSILVGKLTTLYISKTIAGHSVCSDQNGRCSSLCLPKSSMDRSCACENGVELMNDGRTCRGESICSASIRNGKLSSTCTFYVSTSCDFDCHNGYTRKSGVKSLTCLSIGLWDEDINTLCIDEETSTNIGLYAGIAAGGLTFIVIVVIVTCWWRRKRKPKCDRNNMGAVNQAFDQNPALVQPNTRRVPKRRPSEDSEYDYTNHDASVRYSQYPVSGIIDEPSEYLDLTSSQRMAQEYYEKNQSTVAAGGHREYLQLCESQKMANDYNGLKTISNDNEYSEIGELTRQEQNNGSPKRNTENKPSLSPRDDDYLTPMRDSVNSQARGNVPHGSANYNRWEQ